MICCRSKGDCIGEGQTTTDFPDFHNFNDRPNFHDLVHKKLLEILSRLGGSEHKRLRKLLLSPYFDQDRNPEDLLKLYDYIMEKGADEQNPALSKEEVFKHFFPEQAFREKEKTALDTLASALFVQVKQYLTQSFLEKEGGETNENLALLQFYQKFEMKDRFENTLKTAHMRLDANPHRAQKYYFDKCRLELEWLQFQMLYNRLEDDANFLGYNKHMDTYFMILKLDSACSFFNLQRQVHGQFMLDSSLLKTAFHLSGTEEYLEIPLVRIYGFILETLLEKKEHEHGRARQLEDLLKKHEKQIPWSILVELRSYARIFCTRAYSKSGSEADRHQMFELYSEHYEKKVFFSNGMILAPALKNLVTFGLKSEQFDWVRKVLDDNPPEKIYGTKYPQDFFNLCSAHYHFCKKEYEAALEKLNYCNFENPHLGILSDVLLIQIYYETKNDLLEYRLKALDQKVRRTKLSSEVKSRYFNFVKKLEKIIKYSWEKNSHKTAKIREEITGMPNIIEREWLLEKLAQNPK